MEAQFFATPAEFRAWLEVHQATETEVWVGSYRKATGKQGMTWSESVDQALCFGWIDGVRKSIDDERYMQRFTPRNPRSNWSKINVAKVAKLTKEGLMTPAGLAAFEKRSQAKTGIYSYENRPEAFEPKQEARFKEDSDAWAFFQAQPRGYRRTAIWWVISAKREETREKRLATL
ncbi:MAG: hypothetical protein QOH26_1756, partial [Actinomycetota bacterium]|nr:hypothetical protein [Actinomycetota bacterium]